MSTPPLDLILDDLRHGLRRRTARRRARNAAATGLAMAALAATGLASMAHAPATTLASGAGVGQTDATVVLLHYCPPGDRLACLGPLDN